MSDLIIYVSTHLITLFLLSAIAAAGLWFLYSIDKSHYILYGFLVWFPFETVVIRFVPPETYSVVKYAPEIFLYAAAGASWLRYIYRHHRFFPRTAINRWLGAYLVIALVSLLLNHYPVFIWALGVRQLVRYVALFFFIVFEDFPLAIVKRVLVVGAVVMLIEVALGLLQYLAGGQLDRYLFFSDSIIVGDVATVGGDTEFWAPGQRIFATLGRYDRFGSFLALGLVMLFPWLYAFRSIQHGVWGTRKVCYWLALIFGGIALLFTYSRASWLAALAGIVTVGYFLRKNRALVKIGLALAGVAAAYLVVGAVYYNYVPAPDKPSESIAERLLEAVSWRSLRAGYEGYGRSFFIVNTPLMLVPNYPLFGVGPGNYGGGVAAALSNTRFYDAVHLPFGIQNTVGQIDNNWFSIWGEVGTLGLISWIGLFAVLFRHALRLARRASDSAVVAIAEGVCGAAVALIVLGWFGPYFEFRSLMVYFWTAAGILVVTSKQETASRVRIFHAK